MSCTMACPKCGTLQTNVTDSRASYDGIRRRRVCENGHAFRTQETAIGEPYQKIALTHLALADVPEHFRPALICTYNAMVSACDSGSRSESEDSRSEAEGEARQSGQNVDSGIAQPSPSGQSS